MLHTRIRRVFLRGDFRNARAAQTVAIAQSKFDTRILRYIMMRVRGSSTAVVRFLAKEKVAGPNPVSRFFWRDFEKIPTNQSEEDWFFVFLPTRSQKSKRDKELQTMTHFLFRKDDILSSFASLANPLSTGQNSKTTFSLACCQHGVLSNGQCPRQHSLLRVGAQSIVHWTIPRTTFSLSSRLQRLLSNGQWERQHSPFRQATKSFVHWTMDLSQRGALQ